MKKLFLISLIFFLLYLSAKTQWQVTNIGMPYGTHASEMLNIGNYIYAGIWNKGIYYTSNNGDNWIDITNNSSVNIRTISYNKNYLFAGAYGAGYCPIFRSSNSGQNWMLVGTNIPYELVTKIFSKGDTILVSVWNLKKDNLIDFRLFLSLNNGNSWNSSGLYCNVSRFVVAETNFYAATGYGVYVSSNLINWTKINSGLTDSAITTIDFDSLNNILYAGTLSHGVFISTNYGINWVPKNSNMENLTIYSFIMKSNNIFAGTSNGIYISSNYGTNWIPVGLSNWEIISLAINDEYIFAGTMYNSIWKRKLNEIVGINQISKTLPDKYSLSQNYPNPFNPSTIIKFQIKDLRFVTLKVYDINGKEIITLVNEKLNPGEYESSFDGSGFPSGVYFYKLSTGNYSETKKMVLIK